MTDAGAAGDETAANRELWARANSEYADEHAYRAWAAGDITLIRPQQEVRRLVTSGGGCSSTPAMASGSRSCAPAASSSTRSMSFTPRRMPPITLTTRSLPPNGPASGRSRNNGWHTSAVAGETVACSYDEGKASGGPRSRDQLLAVGTAIRRATRGSTGRSGSKERRTRSASMPSVSCSALSRARSSLISAAAQAAVPPSWEPSVPGTSTASITIRT